MAKSRIIKDLANGVVDTSTALKRAKVIFYSLQNKDIMQWVTDELTGYTDDEKIPPYRIARGIVQATYIQRVPGQILNIQNSPFPLINMPEDLKEIITMVKIRDSVEGLMKLSKEKGQLGQCISGDLYPYLIRYSGNPFITIASAQTVIEKQFLENVLANVENKLLEILLLLEEEFGTLDDLDIDVSSKTPEELTELTDKMIVIIYNDNSVTIGNNNKIRDSQIGTVDKE